MKKFNLGPNILKAHEMELFSSRQELCMRKAANVKEENLIAFQGKKRILYYIIQITSVLPLMVCVDIFNYYFVSCDPWYSCIVVLQWYCIVV